MRFSKAKTLAVLVAASAATAGGVVAASAANTPSASPPAAAHLHLRGQLVAGKVVGDSNSGGAAGVGQLVLQEPNGTQITLSLVKRSKAGKYAGQGTRPAAEIPSDIASGEIVVVRERTLQGKPVAARILDLGFQAAP
ncbi:MAG: hypothetical protein ACRENY_07860 [Candidatus Dormibacteria bacterium]